MDSRSLKALHQELLVHTKRGAPPLSKDEILEAAVVWIPIR